MAEPPSAEALLEFMCLAPVGIVSFRTDGTIEMANPAAAALLMPLVTDADLSDLYRVLGVVAPDLKKRVAQIVEPHGAVCDQLQLAVPGTLTVLTLSINKVGRDRLFAVIQDISRAIERETRSRDDKQHLDAIFEHVRDYAIYTVDLQGRIDSWNRSMERIGGWQASDVIGSPFGIGLPADEQMKGLGMLERTLASGTSEFESWRVRKDGSRFWGNSVATLMPGQDGRPSRYLIVTRDLTGRKLMEDRLLALSLTDALTGASNRRAGEVRLEEAFRAWQRSGRGFSLLMVDCDYFKRINDHWGHAVGDEVLIALVRICQDNLRGADVIFRWGGEEFLILLPESDLAIAVAVAERLRLAIAEAAIRSEQCPIKVSVSVGAAEAAKTDNSSSDTVRRVDLALYRAKAIGRNRVVADRSTSSS